MQSRAVIMRIGIRRGRNPTRTAGKSDRGGRHQREDRNSFWVRTAELPNCRTVCFLSFSVAHARTHAQLGSWNRALRLRCNANGKERRRIYTAIPHSYGAVKLANSSRRSLKTFPSAVNLSSCQRH